MPKKRLEEILEFVRSTDLQEVVWEKKGVHISFRRSAISAAPAKSTDARASQNPSNGQPRSASNGRPAQSSTGKPPEPMTIKSTMVGTFFRSDSPNRPPLVVEGTQVASGQPVAAIEAMKIMKDVIAPRACRIVKALVANGHPVEYGQPLFEVEPGSDENANV